MGQMEDETPYKRLTPEQRRKFKDGLELPPPPRRSLMDVQGSAIPMAVPAVPSLSVRRRLAEQAEHGAMVPPGSKTIVERLREILSDANDAAREHSDPGMGLRAISEDVRQLLEQIEDRQQEVGGPATLNENQIWKLTFDITPGWQIRQVPVDAKFLHVEEVGGKVGAWFQCDPTAEQVSRAFETVPTGVGFEAAFEEYLGTAVIRAGERAGQVYHLCVLNAPAEMVS